MTLYRRDGSSYIASLHGFPIFVKFPGDSRTTSDAIQLSSALVEGYISSPTQEEEEKGNGSSPQQDESLQTNNSFGEIQNPLVEMALSSSTAVLTAEETKDSRRLSSMSVSMAYPSAEIPNKVAYIAVQISAIQDLRF